MLLVTPVFKSRRYIKERDGAIGRVKRGDEKVAKRDGKKIIRITSNKSGEDGAIELANNEYIYVFVDVLEHGTRILLSPYLVFSCSQSTSGSCFNDYFACVNWYNSVSLHDFSLC